jgi:hypothetical protein
MAKKRRVAVAIDLSADRLSLPKTPSALIIQDL